MEAQVALLGSVVFHHPLDNTQIRLVSRLINRCIFNKTGGSRTLKGIVCVLGQLCSLDWNRSWAMSDKVKQVQKNTGMDKTVD